MLVNGRGGPWAKNARNGGEDLLPEDRIHKASLKQVEVTPCDHCLPITSPPKAQNTDSENKTVASATPNSNRNAEHICLMV